MNQYREGQMDDLLSKAITNVRHRLIPESASKESAYEPHTQLYTLLQVFDSPDLDTSGRVKFIYEYLMENGGNPRDQVVSIHSMVGNNPQIPLVDKVWKYCKLKQEANKALQKYENLMRDINAFSHP